MKILILNNDCNEEQITSIVALLRAEYSELSFEKINPTIFDTTQFDINSILLICFINDSINKQILSVAMKFQERFDKNAVIIPISFGEKKYISNEPLSNIKSHSINQKSWKKNLANRVGAFLGLKILPKDNQIFISYRVTDGKDIAIALSSILQYLGFKVWRDDDRDEDHEGNLIIGLDVQEQINKAIIQSNLVLLLDTPEADYSKWVHHEIDYAHAHLVPVLPLCIRNDGKKGSHFRKLQTLNRYSQSDDQLNNFDEIIDDIFKLLADVYKRKKNVPFEVANKFRDKGYTWSTLDKVKLLFESKKARKFKDWRTLLSHCPLYDGIHNTFINNFITYTRGLNVRHNENVFIYDGKPSSENEIDEILNEIPDIASSNIIILHHEQIEEFLDQ